MHMKTLSLDNSRPGAVCWFGSWLAIVIAAATCGHGSAHGDTLAALIANVRANERLYEQIELKVRIDYAHLGPVPHAADGSTFKFTVEQHQDVRHVAQGEKFRFDMTGSFRADGSEVEAAMDETRMFDGGHTRVLTGNIANVIDGIATSKLNLRPHMFLLSVAGHPVCLSTYLSGDVAMTAAPDVRLPESMKVESRALGPERMDGHACEKVQINHLLGGEVISTATLWLAVDRNYIPVKLESWTFQWSSQIPIGIGAVTAFVRVDEGVWFPGEAEIKSFDPFALKRGEQRPQWRRRFGVETISLSSAHDLDFFRNLSIPNGTIVYEVGGDKKITKSFIEGGMVGPRGTTAAESHWLLWGNLAIGVVVISTLAMRRRT